MSLSLPNIYAAVTEASYVSLLIFLLFIL